MIWAFFAFLTLFAVFMAIAPFLRRGRAGADDPRADAIAFYKSQMAEIERDGATGMMSPADAESARAEAARRLLAAERAATPTRVSATMRGMAIAIVLFVPLFAATLYSRLGAPSMPDRPRAARNAEETTETQVASAVMNLEKHLQANPDDGRGWELLAPVYAKLGRPEDAVRAFRQSLRANGETAARQADLGEALVFLEKGQVGEEARQAFARAFELDNRPGKPRFYLGLAAEQSGDPAKAIGIWTKLIDDSNPNSPLAQNLRERIARLGGTPAAAAIANLPPDEQKAAIRQMVDNLAAKLSKDGGDIDAWSRLVRAYAVLKENDKARSALADARKANATDPAAGAQLNALARELGLEG